MTKTPAEVAARIYGYYQRALYGKGARRRVWLPKMSLTACFPKKV